VRHVRDELGDLLFQVVFQARIAEEQGLFDLDAVAAAISDKLERRHPHVFGTATVRSGDEQTQAWEEHKAAERLAAGGEGGVLDGIALGLPALTRAAKLGKRAAGVGFDWRRPVDVVDKVEEECGELRAALAANDTAAVAEELGDLLFSIAQLARHVGADPEAALRAITRSSSDGSGAWNSGWRSRGARRAMRHPTNWRPCGRGPSGSAADRALCGAARDARECQLRDRRRLGGWLARLARVVPPSIRVSSSGSSHRYSRRRRRWPRAAHRCPQSATTKACRCTRAVPRSRPPSPARR